MIRKLSVIVLLSITTLGQTQPVELPGTSQGQMVARYVTAFNSGDEEKMKSFFADNVAASALAQRPLEARLDVYRQMRGNMGTIELRRALSANEKEIVVLIQTKKGDWFEIGFLFEPDAPHKLIALRVKDTEAPNSPVEAHNLPATMTEAALLDAVDKHLAQLAAADDFSGAVLIAKKSEVLFQKAYGLASKEYKVPNRVDTKFNIGSINKIFTQIAIGQLVEQGKLSFDDKLGKILPDYPNRDAAEKVTVRQLLTMRSGIGDFFGPEFESTPKNKLRAVRDFLPLFASKPLSFEPDTNEQYSNGGYIVLGVIVERVSGRDYYNYVRENVFKPADMQNTDYYEADVVTPNLASGYTKDGNPSGARRNNIYTRPARGSSAGGGYSTPPDLLRFVAALRAGKLRIPKFRAEQEPGFQGLGIAGGARGINCALEDDEERGFTIIVMSNYDPPTATNVAKQVRQWVSRVKS